MRESVEATCEEEGEGEGKTSKRKILRGNFKKARGRRGDRQGVREQVDRGVSRVIAPRGMSRMPTGVKGSTVHCHVEREKETSISDDPSTPAAFSLPRFFFPHLI